jgi:hypothetical protein
LYVYKGVSYFLQHRPGQPRHPQGFEARRGAGIAWPDLFDEPERLREHEFASQGWDARRQDE